MIASRFVLARLAASRASRTVLLVALFLASCGGSGTSGGGTGSGGGGGGTTTAASGEYLWETGVVTNNLSYSTINTTTGALGTPTVAGGPASNPTDYPSIAIAPSGNYLYAFYATFSQLQTFRMLGPGLQLQSLAGSNYTLSMPYAWSLSLHPSGKFMYVVLSGTVGTIQEITLDSSSGGMTLGPAVTESADLRLGVFDSEGQFLFVAAGSRIFVYQINQTNGSLSPAANSPFTLPSGEQATELAIGGSGASSFLYVDLYTPISNGGGIAAFSMNSPSGALAAIPGSPFQNGDNAPAHIRVDPTKRFLYASAAGSGSIYGFAIDPSTGALNPVPGSPVTSVATVGTVAIDPSGQFLYLANFESSSIYGFNINSTTGSLSPLAGSPFPSVAQPEGLTMMNIP